MHCSNSLPKLCYLEVLPKQKTYECYIGLYWKNCLGELGLVKDLINT
uniref:Uncharacterized protein n=1 Tax=Picea sitchensis TaxID=3332 RepID=D5A978_PICSI|nr:unknown [Picea sitchensis]